MAAKGRELHTLRFLYHADRTRVPFPIVIADGWVNPALAVLLEASEKLFPNLRITYIRYPNDASFSLFYKKMANATARVRTPYLMLVDNDDFVCVEGVRRNLEFLEGAPDYVSCGGGVPGFTLAAQPNAKLHNLIGRIVQMGYRYSANYTSRDLSSDNVTARMLDGYRNYMTTYYNVFRTDAWQTINSELAELDFSDLEIHESYCAMRALTLGKEKSDPRVISYVRQFGTSLGSAFGAHDWVHHLLHSRFTSDFDAMARRLAALSAAADRVDPAAAEEEIRQIFADGLRILMARRYGKPDTIPVWRRMTRPLVPEWLKRLRRHGVRSPAAMRKAVFDALRADGADPAYLEIFAEELQSIDDVLTGSDFFAFARTHAPLLLAP